MNKEISSRIASLGFIFSCLIAIFHFGFGKVEPINEIDDAINNCIICLVNSCASFAMNYFFFVTGFLLYCNYNLHNCVKKIHRRLVSLFIPYVIWNTIPAIPWILNGNLWEYIETTFLLKQWPYNIALWYLYAVFLLAVVSPVIFLILKNRISGLVIIVLFTIVLRLLHSQEWLYFENIMEYGYVGSIIGYLPTYLLGSYFGLHCDREYDNYVLCLFLVFSAFLLNSFLNGILESYVVMLLPLALLYLTPQKIILKNEKLTNLSFLIFSVHSLTKPIQTILKRILERFFVWASIINLVGSGLMLLIVISISMMIWMMLSISFPDILKLITGNRVHPR